MSVVTAGRELFELRLPRFNAGFVWPLLLLVAVMLLVMMPLAFLVLGSFSSARLPGAFSWSTLTLANYAKVWSDPPPTPLLQTH